MSDQLSSFLSPKLETQQKSYGNGTFAREFIKKGELLAAWGGRVVTREVFDSLELYFQNLSVQIDDDLFLVPQQIGPGDYVNHSCNPNAGVAGQITLVALRDIHPGEEICYDYAMTDGCAYDEFDCQCHEPECRENVTGNDWQRRELWEKYKGHFSPYLQRRIEQLRLTEA